jgi:hypothetical protein
MKIVTSFAPERQERQQYCLESWQKYGHKIIAVQTTKEMPAMQATYAGVQWVESFSDRPLVKEMADVATAENDWVLLVNSDISIKNTVEDFDSDWTAPKRRRPEVLRIGIRWDREANGYKKLNQYGIDAFLLSPTMAATLPELGFRIGQPAWDYWLVWHFHALGYAVSTKKTLGLIHAKHERTWTDSHHANGMQLLTDHYGVVQKDATRTIQRLTGRA